MQVTVWHAMTCTLHAQIPIACTVIAWSPAIQLNNQVGGHIIHCLVKHCLICIMTDCLVSRPSLLFIKLKLTALQWFIAVHRYVRTYMISEQENKAGSLKFESSLSSWSKQMYLINQHLAAHFGYMSPLKTFRSWNIYVCTILMKVLDYGVKSHFMSALWPEAAALACQFDVICCFWAFITFYPGQHVVTLTSCQLLQVYTGGFTHHLATTSLTHCR